LKEVKDENAKLKGESKELRPSTISIEEYNPDIENTKIEYSTTIKQAKENHKHFIKLLNEDKDMALSLKRR